MLYCQFCDHRRHGRSGVTKTGGPLTTGQQKNAARPYFASSVRGRSFLLFLYSSPTNLGCRGMGFRGTD
jgi:hypothetical protein